MATRTEPALGPDPDSPRATVLVVDDEATIADVVSRYLDRAGYAVHTAHDGEEALRLVDEAAPDLVVLDVMLPRVDGLEVLRRLRSEATGSAPSVILLSARDGEEDRVGGLVAGADDYVAKPFSPAELVARVEAVLRRSAPTGTDEPLAFGPLSIDPAARVVRVAGVEVSLTQREFELLVFLARHPGRVFTREELMDAVWRFAFYTDTSTVTVHVRRLRTKIEADPGSPRWLRTAWGAGYRFDP